MPNKTSHVWEFMEQLNPGEVMCTLCKRTFRYHNSTSSMRRHLEVKHPEAFLAGNVYGEIEQSKKVKSEALSASFSSSSPKSNRVSSVKKGKRKNSSFSETSTTPGERSFIRSKDGPDRKNQVDRCVLGMVVKDLQPIKVVEEIGFKKLLKGLDGKYHPPSAKYLTRTLLPQVYEEQRDVIYDELQAVTSVCISTEVWTYQRNHNFLSISASFINSDWEPKTALLETTRLTDGYNANGIAMEMERVFEMWEITNKVFCVTTDNSHTMTAAVSQLNLNHQQCFGHNLSLVVQESLNKIPDYLFIKEKITDIVNFFQTNVKAGEKLMTLQQGKANPQKLKMDSETHWNSTFRMFERYVGLHDIVGQALKSQGRQDIALGQVDLDTVKQYVKALEPFDMACKELSADKFTSLSKVIPMSRTLTKYLASSPEGGALAQALKEQMSQQFKDLESNLFPAAAAYLDPRFKDLCFENSETSKGVQDELRAMISNVNDANFQNGAVQVHQGVEKKNSSSVSLWSDFDLRVQESRSSPSKSQSEPDLEFGRYESEGHILRMDNPFEWWKTKEMWYPRLSTLAKQFLSVPATAVSPELMFTKAADQMAQKRNNYKLKDDVINPILFLNKNWSM